MEQGGVNNQFSLEWTEERCELLRRRWEEGASCSVIGAEFGVSRSAIIGKVHRLRLPPHLTKSGAARKPKRHRNNFLLRAVADAQERNARRKPNFGSVRGTAFRGPPLEVEQSPPSETAGKAFGRPCDLLALTRDCCRWPVNDATPHLFCNAPAVEGYPYCINHCRIAYRGAPQPNAKPMPLWGGGGLSVPPLLEAAE